METRKEEIRERISKIRDEYCGDKGKNKLFAKKIGDFPENTSRYCNGTLKAGPTILDRILEAFPFISRAWLYFGEGDMLIPESSFTNSKIPDAPIDSNKVKNNDNIEIDYNRLISIIENKDKQIDRLITLIEKTSQTQNSFSKLTKSDLFNYIDKKTTNTIEKQCHADIQTDGELNARHDSMYDMNKALSIIQDILKDIVSSNRIEIVPRNSYYSIRLDKDRGKPICRLHITKNSRWIIVGRYWPFSKKFYISKLENAKHDLMDVNDIYLYSQELADVATLLLLDTDEKRISWVNKHHKDWIQET